MFFSLHQTLRYGGSSVGFRGFASAKRFRRRHHRQKTQQRSRKDHQTKGEPLKAVRSPFDGISVLFLQRFRQHTYTKEELKAVAWRIPLWTLLVGILSTDYAPFSLLRIHGPSMIPTMAPDGSEIWLVARWNKTYNRNDLIGFAHPTRPHRISCKRIIGMEGDIIKRYGHYVHLFSSARDYGIKRPTPDDEDYSWVNREWVDKVDSNNPELTIKVPEGHVWIEADCPNLGIDSRQIGPIPIEWIQGRVVAKLWPLWGPRFHNRPHPIPLDPDTLAEHNIYHRRAWATEGKD